MSKGSNRRPLRISREEEEIRWALARGTITKEMFDQRYRELAAQGKITRDGRIVDARDE